MSAHPPAARPCVGRERGPRRLRVTPVTTLATHFAPGLQLPSERLRTPLTWPPPPCHADPSEPWLRTLALRSLVPTPPRTSPASDHPTHTFRPGRAREGVDGSKLSEAYSVCHMTKLALVLATHAAASLRAETDILGGGGCCLGFSLGSKSSPPPYISFRLSSTYALALPPHGLLPNPSDLPNPNDHPTHLLGITCLLEPRRPTHLACGGNLCVGG